MAKFAVVVLVLIFGTLSAHGAKLLHKGNKVCEIYYERNMECNLSNVGLRVRPSTVRACACIDNNWMRCEQTTRNCKTAASLVEAKEPEPSQAAADSAKEELTETESFIQESQQPIKEETEEKPVVEVVASEAIQQPAHLEPAKESNGPVPAAQPVPVAQAAVPESAKESPEPTVAPVSMESAAENAPLEPMTSEPAKENSLNSMEPGTIEQGREDSAPGESAAPEAAAEDAPSPAVAAPSEPVKESLEQVPAAEVAPAMIDAAVPEPAKEVEAAPLVEVTVTTEIKNTETAPEKPRIPTPCVDTPQAPKINPELIEIVIDNEHQPIAASPEAQQQPGAVKKDLTPGQIVDPFIYLAGSSDEEKIR